MALNNSLMRYKEQSKIISFDMHGDNKATLHLPNGHQCVVYMSSEYIIGENDIYDAFDNPPKANYLVYNDWDRISSAAIRLAKENTIEVMKFGRFYYKLNDIGA